MIERFVQGRDVILHLNHKPECSEGKLRIVNKELFFQCRAFLPKGETSCDDFVVFNRCCQFIDVSLINMVLEVGALLCTFNPKTKTAVGRKLFVSMR